MKKVICLLLVSILWLTAVCSAFADAAESETVEKLILIAKEKLQIDDETMQFANYYLSESSDNRTLYMLDWESKDENTYKNIHASLNEAGIICSYSVYEDKARTKPSFPKHTEKEAAEAAGAFIRSIDPAKLENTGAAEVERSYDNNYTVTFPRRHNGISVSQNYLCCTVDSNTLKVTEYHAAWQENLTFSQGETLSQEAAAEAFCEHLGYEPFYHIISKDYESSVKLVYRSRYDETVMIDAVTGEPTTLADRIFTEDNSAEKEALMGATAGSSGGANRVQLSPQEQELLEKVSAMLSKEKADTISRSISEFGIGAAYTLENYTVHRRQNGAYSIGLSYRLEDKENYGYKSLQLDAASGQVISYYSGGYKPLRSEEEEVKTVPTEELKEKTIAFMQKYYGDAFAQMTEKASFEPEPAAFSFLRKVNGIKVYNNGVQISYDAKTGDLRSFSLVWDEVDFPEPAQMAGEAAANEKIMAVGEYHLQYMPIQTGENQYSAEPVYALSSKPVLDAQSLESLSYNLQPKAETEAPAYTDTDEHYAEERIEKLLAYGVFLNSDAQGRLLPDAHITQLDYFLLLDKIIWQRGYEQNTESMYRDLIRQNILTKEEVSPNAPVSRLSGITYLLRALGYGDFIKIPDIFVNHFADVAKADAGPVAVAYGLKLINGDGASFYPEGLLSRADAMIIVHNYLQY